MGVACQESRSGEGEWKNTGGEEEGEEAGTMTHHP